MTYGPTTGEKLTPHKEFLISVAPTNEGFEAWIECADRRPVSVGYGFSQVAGPIDKYASADEARAAAVQLIDTGVVRRHP